jgi:hypothetical protein
MNKQPVAMKDQKPRLGDLGLQIAFRLPRQKTNYRTIMYPSRLANKYYGNRACLNLKTNKAVNIACSQEVVLITVNSEVSESPE